MARPRIDAAFRTSASAKYDARRDRTKAVESTVTASRPRMPATLTATEQAFWKSAVSLLRSKGTLAKTDAPTLTLYAVISARYVKANADIEEKGLVYDEQRFSKAGDSYTVRVTNPNVKIAESCERQLLALQKSLGLTPADREKVRKAKPRPGSEPPKPGTLAALRPDLLKRIQKQGAN
jgi:P27 family predicted phage terminase small subunit